MRIVIDMQGAQNEGRFEDGGAFAIKFAQAIVRNSQGHQVFLALNGLFPESIEFIRSEFSGVLPQDHIRVWYAPVLNKTQPIRGGVVESTAELVREAFLLGLSPDVIHVTSMFRRSFENEVSSIKTFALSTLVSVSVDSLLQTGPAKRRADKSPRYAAYYKKKLAELHRADIVIATLDSTSATSHCEKGLSKNARSVGAGSAADSDALDCEWIDDNGQALVRVPRIAQGDIAAWDEVAKSALAIWQLRWARSYAEPKLASVGPRKPRLAFVSPMPPERTGVADYSAELLPFLAERYEVDLVLDQKRVDPLWHNRGFGLRNAAWLRKNFESVDRVIYQMGNSPLHYYMLDLMREIPGVVVLHDFYLSGLMAWQELKGINPNAWIKELYEAHGYEAVRERLWDASEAARNFPANWSVLRQAKGVIVHSKYAQGLAKQWYGSELASEWKVIPHLRSPLAPLPKSDARLRLGFADGDFIVCSFGFVGPSKLNHRLLEAWLKSDLARDRGCHLVFVGQNAGGVYGASLLKAIEEAPCSERVRITGFASPELFREYLSATDIAVQLRTDSRGESSGTVLDAMTYGLPTIVNANGSFAELDLDSVWMLPPEFTDTELIEALELLRGEPERRQSLGAKAQDTIRLSHSPDECAHLYKEAIEDFYKKGKSIVPALIDALVDQEGFAPPGEDLVALANGLAANHPLPVPSKRLFLDVTATFRNDLKTGIERVTRALMLALIQSPPLGYRVEPVYLSDDTGSWRYRYARKYSQELLGIPSMPMSDQLMEPMAGDTILGLDVSGEILVDAEREGLLQSIRNMGVSVFFLVHDLLPVRMPEKFPPEAEQRHAKWLDTIAGYDGAICISKTVADDLIDWVNSIFPEAKNRRPFLIGWSHHGADVDNSAPSIGLPSGAHELIEKLESTTSFVMVGTIEPRKGYLQTLQAFDELWKDGADVNLVIVGYAGWKGVPTDQKRDIPATLTYLRDHPQLNKRLFWLEGISDEYLEIVYKTSTCLICASYGEGFGLPLIEAARYKLPVVARSIPIFREVAGKHAYYFDAYTPKELSEALKEWLSLFESGTHPRSDSMRWMTWKESSSFLSQILRTFSGQDIHNQVDSLVGGLSSSNAKRSNTHERTTLEIGKVKAVIFPKIEPVRTLFVDVSVISGDDFKTGIQRAVRALTLELLCSPPHGFKVEPVRLVDDCGNWSYEYARNYLVSLKKLDANKDLSTKINLAPGDIFLGLDFAVGMVLQADKYGVYRDFQSRGAKVSFVVYDLLPISLSNAFNSGVKESHIEWLRVVAKADSAICISKSTACALGEWYAENLPEQMTAPMISSFHLGADLEESSRSIELSESELRIIDVIENSVSFLMVGTVDPRKGYQQVLDAFNLLWADGREVNLILIGKKGWMVDELVKKVINHPEFGKRLIWPDYASDELLKHAYQKSTCLIAASEGEGFGLPLVEAAKNELPIIARDIEVFREVAGQHAFYFNGKAPEALATGVLGWLELYNLGQHPKSSGLPWLTWRDSAEQLKAAILD